MLTSLILFAIVATLSPGGATTLATASGAQFGYLKSLPLILGIAAALAVLVAVSGAGLSSMLARFPMLSLAMKLAGTGYLLLLAAKIARSGSAGAGQHEVVRPVGFFGGESQGLGHGIRGRCVFLDPDARSGSAGRADGDSVWCCCSPVLVDLVCGRCDPCANPADTAAMAGLEHHIGGAVGPVDCANLALTATAGQRQQLRYR